MSLLGKAVENRRKELINLLLKYKGYQDNEPYLHTLTLSELEYEYYKNHCYDHPHSSISSIHWKNF
ncbi:Fur-regulated basic protein FbpA [Niallia circulans]|uniref:Fur-regulated basic protein FbpA n=1 Tax=Niallia circulans TaxID=1397 RepID=UPI001CFFC7F7|nr:Fur-regulated basic protein FbpA [Niallia circulans]MCB5236290.1 Fur-regulated basic protein FbpA [Niallia circulans]